MPFWKRKPKEPGPPAHGPDFSKVDSLEKALAMVNEGTLEPLYLMPLEFGGVENPLNVVYVPRGLGDAKRQIDLGIIKPLVEDGTVQHYAATPEWRGSSFVPMSIHIAATDPGNLQTEIAIWGEALGRESK